MKQEGIKVILESLEQDVLNEETILSKQKYMKKLQEFLHTEISKFTNQNLLTPEDAKVCLKQVYKSI